MALKKELEVQGKFLFKYRGVLPILIILLGVIAFIHSTFDGTWVTIKWLNFPFELLCLAVSFSGLLIRSHCIGYVFKGTSGRNTKGQVAESLNTLGLYSIARHPLYIGNFMMWLGPALLTRNPWFILFFIFLFWVYYERIMYTEEQFLRNKFGELYEFWASKTPAFIPNFSLWKKPQSTFNYKKVMHKEKNGLLATAVLFLLFEEIEQLITNNQLNIREAFWYYLFSISLIIYVLLKLTIKYTQILTYK